MAGGNSRGKKDPPKSAFEGRGGKFAQLAPSPVKGKKDVRHVWNVKGYKGGLILGYGKKCNAEEEAFMAHFYKELNDSEEELKQLEVLGIFDRRGDDGDSLPQNPGTTWGWRCLIKGVPVNQNTPQSRRKMSDDCIRKFNEGAVKPNYKYPRKMRFGADSTLPELECIDTAIIDDDVIRIMKAAYGATMTLSEMMDAESIMAVFWTDTERGREKIHQWILQHETEEQEEFADPEGEGEEGG